MTERPLAPARRPSDERGFIVFVVVFFVVIAAGLALTARGTFTSLLRERPRQRVSLAAFYAAQGGLEAARAALLRDGAWTGGTVAVGECSAAVTVEAVPGRADLREVVSIGTHAGGGNEMLGARRRVSATLLLAPGGAEVVAWREGPSPGSR
jgi:hypothetical protein